MFYNYTWNIFQLKKNKKNKHCPCNGDKALYI